MMHFIEVRVLQKILPSVEVSLILLLKDMMRWEEVSTCVGAKVRPEAEEADAYDLLSLHMKN